MRRWLVSVMFLAGAVVLAWGSRADERASAPTAPAALDEAGLGESFALGKDTYVIEDMEMSGTVGKRLAAKKADPGSTFVVVHYTIRNDANKTRNVLADHMKLVDGEGREFKPSDKANGALRWSGQDDDGPMTELQPGIESQQVTGFQVPEDAVASGLVLVVPDRNLLSRDSVRVSLTE
jgi:hypothetical protein